MHQPFLVSRWLSWTRNCNKNHKLRDCNISDEDKKAMILKKIYGSKLNLYNNTSICALNDLQLKSVYSTRYK